MEITLEEIQKKFESLPEDLKWAIMAAKVDDNIIEIGQAQNLNVEQMGQLSLETHMVMFGFTHPDKFEESIKGSLNLSDEKTRAIVNAVNEKILKGIREAMKSSQVVEENTEEEVPVPEAEDEEKNTQVLSEHGIEILPAGTEQKKELPNIEKIHPLLTGKLAGPSQIPPSNTQYSLGNITKTTPPPSYPGKEDPYREKPE